MPLDAFELTVVLPGTPERIYEAWLDSLHHSAFTGSPATIEAVAGGRHSAWEGYISGKNLDLTPAVRIVQSWRTTEFPEDAADSRLELVFSPAEGGTRLTLKHSAIPEGQGDQYRDGWKEYYFEPMVEYFTNRAVSPAIVGAVRVVAPARSTVKPTKKSLSSSKKKITLTKRSAPHKGSGTRRRKSMPAKKKAAAKKTAPKKKTAAKKKTAGKKK